MKEEFEFRINYDFAGLLFKADEGVDLGQIQKSVKVIRITRDDPRFLRIPELSKKVKEIHNKPFFFGWSIIRTYTRSEIEKSELLHVLIDFEFDPTGEECGTLYDEKSACKICGGNRAQIGPLILKKGSIPRKDIAITLGGEVVVSEKFAKVVEQRDLKGLVLKSINSDHGILNYYQLIPAMAIDLSEKTLAGINPFDLSISSGSEIYKCPNGHTIGLNLLSEPYVERIQVNNEFDFFASRQKLGVIRGMIRPQPIYLSSSLFRKIVEQEKLTGFSFKIARIE